jgi:glucosamine-6-phosphate deaminase
MAARVQVHADKQAASVAVAASIGDLIRRRNAEGRTAVLGLATGSTPLPLYAELVRLHRAEGLSFRNVVTFNLDEYEGLTGDRPESYRYFMEEHLFRHLDLRPGSTHVPDGIAADQERACAAYEQAIRDAGGLDLQVLGIGRTGHIGFNEPPSAADSRTRRVHLDEVTRRDNASFFARPEDVPHGAITMGVATILEARQVELLAFGPAKAEIVRRAICEQPNAGCPATWLQLHPACTFHLDPDADAEL